MYRANARINKKYNKKSHSFIGYHKDCLAKIAKLKVIEFRRKATRCHFNFNFNKRKLDRFNSMTSFVMKKKNVMLSAAEKSFILNSCNKYFGTNGCSSKKMCVHQRPEYQIKCFKSSFFFPVRLVLFTTVLC